MNVDRARWLASPAGMDALYSLPAALVALPLNARMDALRRAYAPAEASALSEQLDLRSRALARFGDLPLQLYSAAGIEMMTHPVVAARRALRLAATGLPVADLTCGIGGDLAALAGRCERVLGFDVVEAAVLLARHNVPRALPGIGSALHAPVELPRTAVVIDPARRQGSSRRFDPEAFSPPWASALSLAAQAAACALKGPPGLPPAAIPASAEVEFVQFGRSMRETALYLGRGARAGIRRAVVLPAGAEISSDEPEAPAELVPLGDVLFDPQSAVTLAGLVRHLGHRLGARLVDPHLAYLAGSQEAQTPLADAFAVVEVLPFSVSRVRQRLRALGLRPHEIRRRAFPIEPDEFRRLLGPLDGDPATLLCCTIAGRRTVIIARPWDAGT